MNTEKRPSAEAATVRDAVRTSEPQDLQISSAAIKRKIPAQHSCDDCRALTAFHAWRDANLPPSFNVGIDFSDWGIPPAGKRAVIELVTATITIIHQPGHSPV
jgi:hypothetical protein